MWLSLMILTETCSKIYLKPMKVMCGLFVRKHFHPTELEQGKLALIFIEFSSPGRRGHAATIETLRTCREEV